MALAEHTKQARILAIVDAAERLIRADAGTQFSMRALASEAGVSPATPFNLLGSKAKILEALFVRSFALTQGDQAEQFDPAKHNAIEFSLRFCDHIMQRYGADAPFYRTLLSGLGTNFDALLAGICNWQLVIQVAVQQGDLRSDTKVRSLAETIEFAIAGIMAFWSTGDLASERLAVQARFAITVALCAFATAQAQPQLQKHLRSAARALKKQGPLGA